MSYLLKSRLAWAAVVVAALGAAGPAQAQKPILKSDKSVIAAFRSVVAKPSQSTVKVLCTDKDGKPKEAALGTVVGEDGWIVTKNSELTGKIVVKTRDGKTYDATVEGVEDKFDCERGGAYTGGLVAGSYTVSIAALNAASQSVGTVPALTNQAIRAPNKTTDLNLVTIPIDGL